MHQSEKPTIFFDWDGTLADSMELCVGEIALALEWMGITPPPREELVKLNGPTIEEAAVRLNIPDDKMEQHLQYRKDAQLVIFEEKQRLFDGAYDLLASLADAANVVLISNGYPEYLDRSVDLTETRCFFTHIQPCIEGLNKTQVLTRLLDSMKPARAIMVGDRSGDLIAGRDNGLPTVAAAYGYGTAEEWALADYTVRSVEELSAFLHDWVSRNA